MHTKPILKYAAIAAFAGALLAPTASFAGSPFVFGGPGYEKPMHSAATAERGYNAFAYEPGAASMRSPTSRNERACMRPRSSLAYEPCANH